MSVPFRAGVRRALAACRPLAFGFAFSFACLVAGLLAPALAHAATTMATLEGIERQLRGQPTRAALAFQDAAAAAAPRSAEQVMALQMRARMLVRLGDAAGTEAAAARLAEMAGGQPGTLAGAAADLVRADWQIRQGSLARADRLLTELDQRPPEHAPTGFTVRRLLSRAKVKEELGRFDESLRVMQAALALIDREGPLWQRAEARASLAYTYFLSNQATRALSLAREARELATRAEDEMALLSVSTTEGIVLSVLEPGAGELAAMKEAIEHARRAEAHQEEALGLANLADFFLRTHEPQTAQALSRRALELAREYQVPEAESVALVNSGLALIMLGQPDAGRIQVSQSLAINERAGALTSMAQTQLELGQALEAAGYLQAAWDALMEHRRLSDEMFRREHQQAVLELQEEFAADQRRRELSVLDTERQLSQQALRARELQHGLWAAGMLAGVLMLALLALLVRRVRATNAALATTNQHLKVASECDSLTGLANRRQVHELMERSGSAPVEGSLLLVDIDHFKRINDRYGHAMGDAVLVEVARRLRAVIDADAVPGMPPAPNPTLIARWGGEEFLLYVHEPDFLRVERLAERLLSAIGTEPVCVGVQSIFTTASIGFATFPLQPGRQPVSWQRAIDLVDKSMYLAKAHGRNRAYGVRSWQGGEGCADDVASEALESAWRSGRVDLKQLAGPAREPASPARVAAPETLS